MWGEIKSSWDVVKQMYEMMGALPAFVMQLSPHRRISDHIGKWRMKIVAKVISGVMLWLLSVGGTAFLATVQTLRAVPNDVRVANEEIKKLSQHVEAANRQMSEDILETKQAVKDLGNATEKAIEKMEIKSAEAISENRRMIYDHLRDINNGRSKR